MGRHDIDQVIFAVGKNPLEELGGGHSSYVRVHGYACLRAGILPHLFCIGHRTEVVETAFGVVHSIRSPFWWAQRTPHTTFRVPWMPLHAPLIEAEIRRFMRRNPGIGIIHSFGHWGGVGTQVQAKQNGGKQRIVTVASVYTTVRHEYGAKRQAVREIHGAGARLQAAVEDAWARLAIEPGERRWLSESDVLIVNYDSVRRLVLGICPQREDIRILPYSPETAFVRRESEAPELPPGLERLVPAQAPLIVAVSRHDPRKGVDVLLRALARLRAADVGFRAYLAGAGALLGAHRRLASTLGLDGSVQVAGFVPDAFACLLAADIFVLPSHEEGSGSVALLEAMQAACAIVASDIDGIPEDVTHGRDGLLVPSGDDGALATQLAGVLKDANRRRNLQQSARATFEQRFAPERFAESLQGVYEDALR